jgi:hypothetical protein
MSSPTEFKPVTSDMETVTETDAMVQPAQQGAQKRRLLIGVVAGTALLAAGATVAATKSGGNARQADYISRYVESDAKKGCSNWADLNLKFITGSSRSQCDKACHDFNAGSPAANCEAFNFKPSGNCTGDHGGAGAGSCYLFKDGCVKVDNDCWDYYTIKLPSTTSSVTTTTTSTTHHHPN